MLTTTPCTFSTRVDKDKGGVKYQIYIKYEIFIKVVSFFILRSNASDFLWFQQKYLIVLSSTC